MFSRCVYSGAFPDFLEYELGSIYISTNSCFLYIHVSIFSIYVYIIRIYIYFQTSTPQMTFVIANTADGSVNFFQQCKFPQKTTYSIAQKF